MDAPASSVTVDDVRLHWSSSGSGKPVLLLHGMGASSYSWRHTVPALEPRLAVHAFDWPGYGRSDQPWDFDYSPAGYSRVLLGAMDALGIEKASLVGNSMGGLVALWTALESPERVDRLALIGTPVYPEDRPPILWPLRWPVVGALYERALGPWAVGIVARSAFADPSRVTPRMIEEYSLSFRTRAGAHAVAQFLRNVPEYPETYIRRYPELPHPTLVVSGDRDTVARAASGERFSREVPKGEFVLVPSCGHAAHEEKPETVNAALTRFLE